MDAGILGWNGSAFVFYDGYWGPQVGFYGGINFGFGYFGDGYVGGRWDHGHFFYNRAVSNVNVTVIHNVYNERVTNVRIDRVSYNGGRGGVTARPTPEQQDFARQRHMAPVAGQTRQMQAARDNRDLRASVNHGKPPIAATARPGEFTRKVVKAKAAGAPYNRPSTRSAANARGNANMLAENKRSFNAREPAREQNHPNNVSGAERGAQSNTERAPAESTRNAQPKQNHQEQQEQQKLAKQQEQRQQVQRQQVEERQQHQQQQQHAEEQRTRAVEQRHAQPTRQPQQRQEPQRQEPQRQEIERRQSSRPPAHPEHAEHSAPAERKPGGR